MDKKQKIKAIIFLYITLGFTVYLFNDYSYENNQYIIYDESEDAFGTYKGGKIYIGDRDNFKSLEDIFLSSNTIEKEHVNRTR